jgi:hypothetical protein
MKKAIVSVLRLTMFVGVLALLPGKGPEAQIVSQCVTFNTDDIICPSCCSMPGANIPNNIIAESSPTGIQSILNTNYSCGTPATCNGSSCSGTYPQAVSDSNCCIASGSACASNEPCCPGTICRSSGLCGACSEPGGACGTNSDCCSGLTCSGGICTTNSGGGSCGYCPNPNPACYPVPCGSSPILIDISGQGFSLTSAANGVKFDIFGTGNPIQMGWTAPGADNAFLALPGADGLVHSGKQLFGNFTPQPSSATPNGFAALAVYDMPANGGNGNGMIDAGDAIFSSLRLWIDANHDGIAQPEELHTLPSLGVNSISLNYKADQRTDQYGNVFHYRAQINPGAATNTSRMAYDVFFVTLTGGL